MYKYNEVDKIAYFISGVFHPVVIIALSSLLLNTIVRENITQAILDSIIIVSSIIPALVYNIKKKRREDYGSRHHVSLTLALIGLATALTILWRLGAPIIELQAIVIGIICGVGGLIINRAWNISFHATIPAICAVLLLPVAPAVGVCLSMLAVIVGLARLPIKQHTIAQVVGGWVYGFTCTATLVLLMAQYG